MRWKCYEASSAPTLSSSLIILFLANAFLLNGLVWLAAPVGFNETTLHHSWRFMHGEMDNDSWWVMEHALEYFEQQYLGPVLSKPIYSELVLERGIKFQYPPSALFITAGLRAVSETNEQWAKVTNALSLISVFLVAMATAALLEVRLHSDGRWCHASGLRWIRIAAVIGLTLTFYPVVKAYTLGQVQAWLNALLALALLSWSIGHRSATGLLVGLTTLVKPHYGLFLLWAIVRREWRFAIPCALTICAGFALSVHVFGWDNHLDYVKILSHIGARGEAFYPNQTVNGLLNRLMSLSDPINYNNIEWRGDHFPPVNVIVNLGTLLTSAVILAIALLRPRHIDDRDGILDFCVMLLSVSMASPIAWEHHYGILLPIYAVALVCCLRSVKGLAWLACSYVLASNFLQIANWLAPTVFNPVQSYLFMAALMLFLLLQTRTIIFER